MSLRLMWMNHLARIHFMMKNKPSKESLTAAEFVDSRITENGR